MSIPFDVATVDVSFFEPLLTEKFSTRYMEDPSGQAFELELVRTAPFLLGDPAQKRAPFSLFFDGPKDFGLPQGIYTLDHPKTGPLDLFLVPVARRENRVQLQGAFS